MFSRARSGLPTLRLCSHPVDARVDRRFCDNGRVKRTVFKLVICAGVLLAAGMLAPIGGESSGPDGAAGALGEAVSAGVGLLGDYARRHLLAALLPAILISGAITAFLRKGPVLRLLGPAAPRWAAFTAAAVAGAVLAVCSCSVLPLFAAIFAMGAGIGPASTFLYAGPAINILAIVLTAGVLGLELGVARGVAAVVLGLAIGLAMGAIFRRRQSAAGVAPVMPTEDAQPLYRPLAVIGVLGVALAILNWSPTYGIRGVLACCPDGAETTTIDASSATKNGTPYPIRYKPGPDRAAATFAPDSATGDNVTFRTADWQEKTVPAGLVLDVRPVATDSLGTRIHQNRFLLAGLAAAVLATMMLVWFGRAGTREWLESSARLGGQILPLLIIGVLASGMLFGSGARGGIVPQGWIAAAVGGEGVLANLTAAVAGAAMYFATLTEVPIIQGLMSGGMGRGPALAMLLAGPAVSLPSLLVLRSVIGTRKTLAFAALVVAMSAAAGMAFGK